MPVKYLKALRRRVIYMEESFFCNTSFRGSFTLRRHTVKADVTFVGYSSVQCLLNVGLCCWMAHVLYIKVRVINKM